MLKRRQYRVSNPACVGRSLSELQLRRISEVNITRLARGGDVQPAHQDTPLQLGDILVAVGRTEELDFTPTGSYVMELGDLIRLTGNRSDVARFVKAVGQEEKRIHETSMPALSLGIFLGVLLAYEEFTLPGGASFRLGLAGGPLLVSLVLAHFGRIGEINVRIPRGAKYVLQQLGLVLFLAAAGTAAGASLGGILSESGPSLLIAGALITLTSAVAGLLVTRYLFKQDLLTVLGAISGAMTSSPALGAVSEISSRNEATLAYTGVYPVALIMITVVSQFLYFLL